jgi:NADPH-dependent curcumin reductase CurA
MALVNHRYTLAARPVGLPKPADFTYEEAPVRDPDAGEILVKNRYISLDPAMRGWMNDARSYIPPIKIGDVFRALTLGEVVAAKDAGFAPGEHVVGLFGVQEYATVAAKEATKILPIAPLPVFLSALGMTGLTAYFGLLDVGKPQAGETVVVSAAAGAVGSIVGQIAKIKGCRVVGIAGGAAKCDYLRSLGFDAAIDYKSSDVAAGLREHCPDGIHVYFDNVGGDILDAALARLAKLARVVICGAISQFNASDLVSGPSNYLALLVQRASMTGMIVMDYAAQYPQAIVEMAGWMAAGKLKSKEHIVKGLETFPQTLLRLFSGDHDGKLILEV